MAPKISRGDCRLTQPPLHEPVTLEEAMTACRADNDLSAVVASLLIAGREAVERYTNRAIMAQTIEVVYDGFPSAFELPRPPFYRLDSVKCYDTQNNEYILSVDDFIVYNYGQIPTVTPKSDNVYPSVQPRSVGACIVSYIAGQVSTAEVPLAIKHAIMLYVTWHIDHPDGTGNSDEFNTTFYGLLKPFRIINGGE